VTGPRVDTVAGTVEGETVPVPDLGDLRRFLGVPYAAAPDGPRRWRPPQPARPWPGVRPARTFGPAAPQTRGLASPLPSFQPTVTGDDCLSLNVWTPALDGRRPVLVWIHGGAYTSGGSSQPVYDAARLAAEHDLVVVTINYRLGVLGFLTPLDGGDGTVANAGLHDQRAALAWVRDHIAGFGGDAGSVTAVGESAGAGSILHLLAAADPPPFDRAVAQSGEPRTLSRDDGATVAEAFARAVGDAGGDPAHLDAAPLPLLLDAQDRVARDLFGTIGIMVYAPTVDDALLTDDVRAATAAGAGAAVPLVLGTTRDELHLFPDPASATLDAARLTRRAARLVPGTDPAATIEAYRAELGGDPTPGAVWEALRTGTLMRIPNLRLAEQRAAHHAATHLYRFDWAAPTIGAAHAVDVPFTFGTFDREGWGTAVGADRDAEHLGRELRARWAAFARRGTPNPGEVDWPPYQPPRRATMLFDRASRVVDDPDRAVRACHP